MITRTFVMTAAVISAVASSSCTAHAEPPKFPDINSYPPVNAADYSIDTTTPGMPARQVYFITPDGIECNFDASSAACSGNNFPNIPAQPWNPAAGITGVNVISTNSGLSTTNAAFSPDHTVHGQQVKNLPPMHSITMNGVTCGVDGSGTTACKDAQGQGFILSPRWSGWQAKW